MPEPSPHAVPTRFDGAPDRVALVIPGVGYTPARPLLHFARSVLLRRGWTVQELWWQLPDEFREFEPEGRTAWVERQVAAAVDAERGACGLIEARVGERLPEDHLAEVTPAPDREVWRWLAVGSVGIALTLGVTFLDVPGEIKNPVMNVAIMLVGIKVLHWGRPSAADALGLFRSGG
ncbi:hypothetical protein ACFU6K_13180 [Kitasatospora sp. NPDC057512]|uniref:hypothetical protein n=1 Tax=Kitasatospora sp. NPDC057512 TaxID=3346154 RepID=UPI003694BD50